MMQDKSVSGTRRTYAVITGATSGLGLAYAKWFGGKGYDLIITGRRKNNEMVQNHKKNKNGFIVKTL